MINDEWLLDTIDLRMREFAMLRVLDTIQTDLAAWRYHGQLFAASTELFLAVIG